MRMSEQERLRKYPSIRFECRNCGITVVTDSTRRADKRTTYCCASCEREYWRKVTRHANKRKQQEEA